MRVSQTIDGNTLIAHLGMSGRMTLHDAKSAAEHPFERRRKRGPLPR